MTGKRAYHHGELREALLAASASLLADRGLDGFTLREAARRAGVSPAAPKHHFGDVKGLLTELAIGGFGELADALAAAGEGGGAAADRLLALGRAYVRFALAHPAIFDLMFRRARLDAANPRLKAAGARAIGALESVVAEIPALGGDPLPAWSLVHGLARLALDGQLDGMTDGDIATFLDARLKHGVTILAGTAEE